jgi:3-oxoacyl-[acyl-carrier-protein] synthase II
MFAARERGWASCRKRSHEHVLGWLGEIRMAQNQTEVWITGIGLVSSLGEGVEAHWERLGPNQRPLSTVEQSKWAPYVVHPLVDIDLSRQITKTSDLRQMDRWQRIGVYAAGEALADAKLLGDPATLDHTDLNIAAGNGERDLSLDARVLETAGGLSGQVNQLLMTGLRPTLYLGQLSNLLAGNISIIHKATGVSRTFKGEEMAGVDAVEDAFARLSAGQSDVVLVGGALNAERQDLLLNLELGDALLRGGYRPVWDRYEAGGGMAPGSVGAFLVLEQAAHARRRGVRPYARLSRVVSDRSRRRLAEALHTGQDLLEKLIPSFADAEPIGVLSGVSGVEHVTHEEKLFMEYLAYHQLKTMVRGYGSMFGHGMEPHFITGVVLAAIALSRGAFYAPFDNSDLERGEPQAFRRVLVTGFGHWRGEALALVESVGDPA